MAPLTPFDRLQAELEAAAERQAAAPVARRRRWRLRGRSLGLFSVLAVVGTGAAAWAAASLLINGTPVPYAFGAPVAGAGKGAPVPGTVRLLVGEVADPAGGPPWGMRYWTTDRGYACLQVGRVYQGRLGQITGGKVFHELQVGVTENMLGGCYLRDGGDHAFAALHSDARRGAQPSPCAGGSLPGKPARCPRAERTIDFGLLGPNATSLVYRAGGRDHRLTPQGGVGGYLIVQKGVPAVMHEVGFHHKDPRSNLIVPYSTRLALTPASQVIRRVDYTAGACRVHLTENIYGACNRHAGYVPIPQPSVPGVRAPVRVSLAADGRRFRVRFRARQAAVDGRSAYAIEIRTKDGRPYLSEIYEHDVAAGSFVTTSFRAHRDWHGTYPIVVHFRTVRSHPGPVGSPAAPGLLVGRASVTFR